MAALLIAATGCTLGDDSTEVVVDDGGDAMAALTAAVERTQSLSGEFTMRSRTDMTDLFESLPEEEREGLGVDDGILESEVTGRFDGENMEAVIDASAFTLDDELDWPDEVRFVVVDGVSYATAMPFEPDEVTAALGSRTWIEQEVPEDALEEMGLPAGGDVLMGAATPADVLSSLSDLSELIGLREEAGSTFDGADVRTFRGEISVADMWPDAAMGDEWDDELDPAQRERMARIEAYQEEHLRSEVTVLVDTEGLVRRVEVVTVSDVAEEFRDCMHLAATMEGSLVTELRALGSEVQITAPDPADVMTLEEYDGLYDQVVPDTIETDGGDVDIPDELLGDLPSDWRELSEQVVRDGAGLIGLDPATIPTMTDDELFDAEERIYEAEALAPTTPTALGDMTHSDLLWHVRQGMEREGVDPSMADGMTDEQLAGLIDAYMADPALAAKVPEGYRVPNEDGTVSDGQIITGAPGEIGEISDDWYFEGCPA
jgi:hypothetical protein